MNYVFTDFNEALEIASRLAERDGVAYYILGAKDGTLRGRLTVICSDAFKPGEERKIAIAVWPGDLTRCETVRRWGEKIGGVIGGG